MFGVENDKKGALPTIKIGYPEESRFEILQGLISNGNRRFKGNINDKT